MKQFVLYFRVSTRRQGDSGLGLDAQRRDINLYLETYAEVPFEVLGEFTDVKSGRDDERPDECRLYLLSWNVSDWSSQLPRCPMLTSSNCTSMLHSLNKNVSSSPSAPSKPLLQ